MACLSPTTMINPRYKKMTWEERFDWCEKYWQGNLRPADFYIEIPCGNCLNCQKRRMNDYKIRLLHEISRYPNSVFITLTFDDVSLDRFKDNPNKAVRLFLDRMRKRYGKQVRHWIIAEYGTLHGRIHYHGILFNVPKGFNADSLRYFWKYGHIYIGYANEKTASYIVKYCTKNINNGKTPPRVVSSQGIGKSYLRPDVVSFHRSNLIPTISVGRFNVPMPRYYYNKIFSEAQRVEIFKMSLDKPFEKYFNGKKYVSRYDYVLARDSFFRATTAMGLNSPKKRKQNNYIYSLSDNHDFLDYFSRMDYLDDVYTALGSDDCPF